MMEELNLIKPNVELLDLNSLTPLEVVEKVGRVCYQSEDKIQPGSAYDFVKRMIKNKHYAVLEHGRLVFTVNTKPGIEEADALTLRIAVVTMKVPQVNPCFSRNLEDEHVVLPITLRTLFDPTHRKMLQAYDLFFFEYVCNAIKEYDSKHETGLYKLLEDVLGDEIKYTIWNDYFDVKMMTYEEVVKMELPNVHHITAIYTTNRGVTHEFVRHRPASFAQSSTRYIDYSNVPVLDPEEAIKEMYPDKTVEEVQEYRDYLLKEIYKPVIDIVSKVYKSTYEGKEVPKDLARNILPNMLVAKLAVTTTAAHYINHILPLRYMNCTGKAHPEIKYLMGMFLNELKKVDNIDYLVELLKEKDVDKI